MPGACTRRSRQRLVEHAVSNRELALAARPRHSKRVRPRRKAKAPRKAGRQFRPPCRGGEPRSGAFIHANTFSARASGGPRCDSTRGAAGRPRRGQVVGRPAGGGGAHGVGPLPAGRATCAENHRRNCSRKFLTSSSWFGAGGVKRPSANGHAGDSGSRFSHGFFVAGIDPKKRFDYAKKKRPRETVPLLRGRGPVGGKSRKLVSKAEESSKAFARL